MPFRNRDDAGRQLALRLLKFKGEEIVVFALPRGGAPVAAPIAEALGAPLDLVLVRKIGVPFQAELAMGAVADGGTPITVRNEDVIAMARVSEETFEAVRQRELEEIERRRRAYVGSRPRPEAQGHIAIVVDDGVATGATTRAALRAVRALNPSKLVLATPVAPPETLASLAPEADETICLETPADFSAIGCFYGDFRQTSDTEVVAILDRLGAKKLEA